MSTPVWPSCAGATAALIRERDWSATALGARAQWSITLRTLIDVVLRSPVGMALIWGDDPILIYNDAYAEIAGDRHPAVFGAPVREAWPEAWDFNRAVIEACCAGEERVYRDQHFVIDRLGVPADVWFDLFYSPAVDEHTGMRGVIAVVIETTERVQGERQRALQAERLVQANADLEAMRTRLEAANRRLIGDMEFLNTLFRKVPSFIAVLKGPEHVFELANDSYLRLVQNRPVLGQPVALALPEMVEQGFTELLDSVYASGEPFYGRNVDVQVGTGDGVAVERRILDFVYQPLEDADGTVFGIFVEGIDVTEHALTEERLRIAQEAGEIGTFEWYPSTGKVLGSDCYRRLWGFGPDTDITADLLVSRVVPGYRHLSGPERLPNDNPLEYAEYLIERADTGERRWIARRGQAMQSTVAGETRYLGVAFDITERKRTEENLRQAQEALRELNDTLARKVVLEETGRAKAEEALRQAQKMEAVGQLASGVAHDFNNVLQIISSNLQLMELDGLGAASSARLEGALAAVERGSKLSSQLLAFARRQPLLPVATDLGQLVDEMQSLLQRAMGDRIAIDLQPSVGLWSVEVDRNQLENAILNMAINARDAMAGNGRLTITVENRCAEADGGEVFGAEHVCLSLADTGCGMTPEVLAKIFDPFYTTKAPGKGTGLGMSMVYGFVKQSGGDIRIDSQPGQGTTMRICLPRVHGAALPLTANDLDADSLPGAGETVLVVDDDPAVLASTIDMLNSLGYRTASAGGGQEALEILSAGLTVDLLFSDLSMPGATDYAALVAQCRLMSPATRILLTSGQLPDARRDETLELLPKPYSRAQLARALRQQLGEAGPRMAAASTILNTGADRSGARILVVEDDEDTRELACELLAALGHQARGAESAEAALALLGQPSDSGAIEILFTDLNLPGLSGIELARRALATQPALKVIVSSGEGNNVALPPGAGILLLPKPYDLVQLQSCIAQAAASPASA